MITLDFVYVLMGVLTGGIALVNLLDHTMPRRFNNAAFWGIYSMTFFAGSYALPCNTAFTAASRTAIAICMTSSSPKPVSDAIRLAVCSALSTVSSVESHL